MKNALKKCGAIAFACGLSVLSFAQEASGADGAFSTYMDGLKTSITSKVVTMLPILGAVAGVAMVIFLAMFVFRKVKAFMGR